MKKYFVLSALMACSVMTQQAHAKGESVLMSSAVQQPQIIINNRILAKVNGKAISVIDLMKKMDLLFYREYPQYASSVEARYQFYQMHWKQMLSEIIDKELIIIDSEEGKLIVNPGDVREEMEQLFGPNIILNLDKVGLTFNEAYQMILNDIRTRRMIYFKVQSKVFSRITPQKIRNYYDDVAKDHIRDNEWVYNIVTIRHRDGTKAAERANLAYRLLKEDKIPVAGLDDHLKKNFPPNPKTPTVAVSEELHIKEKELSDVFKKTLETLTPGTYSAPIVQKSRNDNSTVIRIFFLKDMVPGGVVPFEELSDKIKGKLIEEGIAAETDTYLKKLRRHFDVQDETLNELLSSDFQPFMINANL